MALDPQSFRDHLVSVYQSMVDQAVRGPVDATTPLASRPGLDNSKVLAATQVAALTAADKAVPAAAPGGIPQVAWDCARLGMSILQAHLQGDSNQEAHLKGTFDYAQCSVNWLQTIEQYFNYFGPDGARATIPYIRAGTVGPVTLPLKAGATVALLADWGTGTDTAVDLLKEVAQQSPDVLIHLGDIYYSGTADECNANFARIVNSVLQRDQKDIPVYTLAGNHDMYSGGAGYYGLIDTLNPTPWTQPASFFCLRNDDWQFIAMDTGLHDYDPLTVTDVLTYLEQDEEDWITDRISEFDGKTILLSHHQLFSAFSQIGPAAADGSLTPYNPRLKQSYLRFSKAAKKPIAAWFWGHEHALTVYDPYLGVTAGRCIGHGAVPVFDTPDASAPLSNARNPPTLKNVMLGTTDHIYMHGFTIIRLGAGGTATAQYYEDRDGSTPMYTETF
jgi:hypothetical protein